MERNDACYKGYLEILKRELIPAMGCTEPIAIAYAAALAKKYQQDMIDKIDIYCSGNIIKNVKSVTVPNTNGKKGIEVAAALGVIAGNADKELEVIADVSAEQIAQLDKFLADVSICIHHASCDCALDITLVLWHKQQYVKVKIENEHANVVLIEKDGKQLFIKEEKSILDDMCHHKMSMEGIYEFALCVEMEDVNDILARQVAYNMAIAEEGLKHSYGANIGSVLLSTYGNSIQVRARALAAAGSDARMSGCDLPVIINSGSGNQGMSASLPVIAYAQELNVGKEQLYRALIISNLSTLYQKKHIGRLSAYCGAVSAGAGAGAGIAYLLGGNFDHICHTIVNALAITSGIICDGAKASCAAKIASAVDAGIVGCYMYNKGKQFYNGEGIVCKNIEETIESVGVIARVGMKETDDEIIKMMMKS